jgi:hypothetical protein
MNNEANQCKCKVCEYRREFEENIGLLDPYSYKFDFFSDMYDRLERAETDRDFYKMKYQELKEEEAYKNSKLKESMRYYE